MLSRSELLAKIGTADNSEYILQELEDQLATPVGVIPFVGAGLSIPFGFPSWSAFLVTQAEKVGIKEKIDERLAAGEYEEAADDLLEAHGPRAFHDAINGAYSPRKLEGKNLQGAVVYLPQLVTGPVITTNFDHVLERTYGEASKPFEQVVVGAKADSITMAVYRHRRFLLKVHGDAQGETSERILSQDDYQSHYGISDSSGIDFNKPLPKLLRLMMSARPVLFIGCSLNQDRTVHILEQIARDLPSTAHYAIVERPPDIEEFHKRHQFLSNHAIRPIWYEDGRYELIESILDYLIQRAVQKPGQLESRQPEPTQLKSTQLEPEPPPPPPEKLEVCPYKGREPFTERDADFFCGRQRVVEEILKTLNESTPNLLTIFGPSGSGLSSIVRAGVIPALREGMEVLDSEHWETIVTNQYDNPLERLEAAKLTNDREGLLGATEVGLVSATESWFDQHLDCERLVLFLDQFEEILISCSEQVRHDFMMQLTELLNSPCTVTIVLVLWDGTYEEVSRQAPDGFGGYLGSDSVKFDRYLSRDELIEIVGRPAEYANLRFEHNLLEKIVEDVFKIAHDKFSDGLFGQTGREEANYGYLGTTSRKEHARSTVLPLLADTLTRLCKKSQGGMLTSKTYEDIGGLTGRLGRWATDAYGALGSDERRLALRILTHIALRCGSEDGRDAQFNASRYNSCPAVSLSELIQTEGEEQKVQRIVHKLTKARVLVTTASFMGEQKVEIMHPSLIEKWGLLRKSVISGVR